MATEQYSIGYEEGFQNGWNAAVDSLPAQPQQDPFIYYRHYDGGTQDFPDEKTIPLYTSTPAQRKPLTDEEIWKFWWSRPEVPDGEDDSMEAEFVAAVRRVLAAHGIKEKNCG